MSSDRITTEQRKGIHDRARTIGYNEGLRSGVNQLASYVGPDIGKVSLWAVTIVLDANEERTPQREQFSKVAWSELGVETLDDLQALRAEEVAATQANARQGRIFAAAVAEALACFNLQQLD